MDTQIWRATVYGLIESDTTEHIKPKFDVESTSQTLRCRHETWEFVKMEILISHNEGSGMGLQYYTLTSSQVKMKLLV